jgi:hypothetical protein
MTMAAARKDTVGELRAQVEAMLVPQWVTIGAIAFSIPVPVNDLVEWLAGHSIAKTSRFEGEVARFVESRAAWLAEVNAADPRQKAELRAAKAREVRALSEKLVDEPSRTPYADMLNDAIVFGLHDLLELLDEEATNCWKCSAPPHPPTAVEEQIALNLRRATWQGWPEGVFQEKLRNALVEGDLIVAINAGRVWVRRVNGSVYCVLRGYPCNAGGVEEWSEHRHK